MTREVIAIALTLALLAGFGVGLSIFYKDSTGIDPGIAYFEGTEIFLTENEYQAFKITLGESKVDLVEALVLSSNPPIIVKFKVEAESLDTTFPYGERSLEGYWAPRWWDYFMFSFACLLAIIVVSLVLAFTYPTGKRLQ